MTELWYLGGKSVKHFAWLFAVLLIAPQAWGGPRKLTVQQLKDLLDSMHQAQKSDADVAGELKDVELTEELTHATMNSLQPDLPGQLSTEQIFILEIRSATLLPPAADLPTQPAPDAPAQKAILDKAVDYATKTYTSLPPITVTKGIRRFQDNPQLNLGSVGAHSSAVVAGPTPPIRYTATSDAQATIKNGIEVNSSAGDRTHWGENGMIAILGQGPSLPLVIQDAESAGKINWVRWEMVNGHQAAVFSFSVDKKKTHYAVDYCCFPESDDAADQDLNMRGGTSPAAGGASPSTQPGGNAQGNYKSNAHWKDFKGTEPYHGEVFIDPNSGVIVRLITEVDFKSSDLVRKEDQRIDFGVKTLGDKTMVLPVQSIIDTLELPYGDSIKGRSTMRHTLFTIDYSNYQAAGS
jgi:hypothetical protein